MPSKVRILPSPPILFAGIAQLVEREPSKLGVAGSSPVSRSNPTGSGEKDLLDGRFAHVAQSVEHFLGKEEVAGSIPAVGFERTLARIDAGREGR